MIETSLYKIRAIKEYFTRFVSIKSVDDEGNEVRLRFTKQGKDDDSYEYCDKVRVGETLDEAIVRSMRDDLGLEVVTSGYSVDDNETAKNKYGEELQRIMVEVLVKYKALKNYPIVGLVANWKKWGNGNRSDSEEALEWLKKETTSDLACNRFETKEEAIDFVKKLYEAGAVKVWAEDIEEDRNGDHTDSLRVIMPADTEKRKQILELANKEQQNEFPGEPDQQDMGQTELLFWWD